MLNARNVGHAVAGGPRSRVPASIGGRPPRAHCRPTGWHYNLMPTPALRTCTGLPACCVAAWRGHHAACTALDESEKQKANVKTAFCEIDGAAYKLRSKKGNHQTAHASQLHANTLSLPVYFGRNRYASE